MNFKSLSAFFAILAIAFVLLTYVTAAPLLPIAIILVAIAVIVIRNPWRGGTAPTQTTTASKIDLYTFIHIGSKVYATASQNY